MMLNAFIMIGKRLEGTVGELVKVRINPKYFHEIVRYIPYSHGDPIGRWSIFEAREYFDGWLLHGKVFHKKVFDIVEEETEMSRSSITDKGSGMQPPKPTSEWFGFKYRVTPETSKRLQEAVFKDGGRWGGEAGTTISYLTDMYLEVKEDGNIWRHVTDTDFSASNLPEKQPPQATKKDFIVGKYYKCIRNFSFTKFETDKYYKLFKISGGLLFTEDMYNYVGREGFDINSESDYDPNPPAPASYTAYVVFKQESTGFGRNTYNGKEYAYKCSRDDYTQWVEYRAFDEDVFAEVPAYDKIKTVKVVRVEAKVDPKATKSIVRILPKEPAIEKKTSRIDNIVKVTINRDDFFSKDDVNTVIKHFNQQEEIGMSTTQRKVVKVELFDNDAGLPVENSLVFYKADVITEDSDSVTVQEIIASGEIAKLITKHNELRGKTTDLEVQKRTGQSVKLQPIKLKNLVWKVDGRIVG